MAFVSAFIKSKLSAISRSLTTYTSKPYIREMRPSIIPAVEKEKRSGILAVKKGMTAYYDAWGVRSPCTILQIQEAQVCQIKTISNEGYSALQIGVMDRRPQTVTNALRCHYSKLNVQPKRLVREFMVPPHAVIPTGFSFSALHFVPGQYVDVRGTTIGKGFQGGMKRWGFKGLPASHGVSRAHRSIGSTGCRQDPGKVWKGKKMPGRMGGKNATMECLQVVKVDGELNTVWVRGSVPGHLDNFVEIKDAIKRINPAVGLPFPTFVPGVHTAELLVQHQVETNSSILAERAKNTKAAVATPKTAAKSATKVFSTSAKLIRDNVIGMEVLSGADPVARRSESRS